MGNSGTSRKVGIGDVVLETSVGGTLRLKEVRHVEDLRFNLLSTGKLDDKGFVSTLGNGTWKLSKGSMVVARAKKLGSLYRMPSRVCAESVNAFKIESPIELWHKRLGHIGKKGLDELAKKSVFSRHKGVHLKKCVHCLLGKQSRVSFSHPPPRR